MGWLRNISFTPSSLVRFPGTGGGGDSSGSDDHNDRRIVWRFGGSRYLRQRKLRNLSGRERATAASLPKWSDSAPELVSSPCSDRAVPLPLPEDSPAFLQRRNGNLNSGIGDGDCPLPSPKGSRGRAWDDRDSDFDFDFDFDRAAPALKIGAGVSATAPIKSIFDSRERQKREDRVETKLSRRVSQETTGSPVRYRNSFRIDVPSRSAPTSPLASPMVSPQRNSSSNLSNFNHVANFHYAAVPLEKHVWSAPELLPSSGLIRGVPPAFFDGSTFSCESSPMHSPRRQSPRGRSPRRDPRSPTGAARRENVGPVSVHPLPLPPGVSMPSPSTPMPSPSAPMPSPSAPMPLPSTSTASSSPLPLSSAPITRANSKTEATSMKNQWQKGKLIGRGTFGSVYVASNRENGSLCAMKEVELFYDDPKSAECIKQLEQEIKLLSQLKHPNIVQYYGSDVVEDRLYIYLEYVHPGSINKYVRDHCGAMTESVVRNFTRHILSGLAYLHSTKTIHRDIKGANLLVDSSGVVKLADFGMAKHSTSIIFYLGLDMNDADICPGGTQGLKTWALKLTGQVADLSLKGSPYWMAPELLLSVMQKDNNSDLALAVDIWSLGCTIIEMFTGKPPWSEYEGAAAMFKVMKDTPSIPESLSYEAADFLKCCFRRNPAERLTAAMLLEHPFMKNLQHSDASACSHAIAGANLADKCYSPSEQYSSKFDQFSMFPSSQSSKGQPAVESVIGPLAHHEISDLTVMSRHSPRSTLEALPILSPRRSVHNVQSPANALGFVKQTNKKNHV